SIASRLLTPPIVARRQIASDAEEWSIRLAALATLGQYDGLTFLVDGTARSRYTYNVVDDPVGDVATRSAIEETRRSGATIQTSSLDHDLAQIWLFGSAGALELIAARPHENLRFEQMLPSEHDALAHALHQRRLVRIGQGALRPWVSAEIRELIVVPLADRARSVGALVLGRAQNRYENSDE